jgi:hypothetical protein
MCKGIQCSNASSIARTIINKLVLVAFIKEGFQSANSSKNAQALNSIFYCYWHQEKQFNNRILFFNPFSAYYIIKIINQIKQHNKILTEKILRKCWFLHSLLKIEIL